MGNCGSLDPAHEEIEARMTDESKKDKKTKKLLFLGSGSSGKSTLFKQLTRIHGDGFDESQIQETALVIQNNCVSGILTLLKQSQVLYDHNPEENKDSYVDLQEPDNAYLISIIENVVQLKDVPSAEDRMPEDMVELGECIAKLWELPQLKMVFNHRFNNFCFPDNMDFFFDKVAEVMHDEFIPDDEDILRARARTSGILEKTFEIKEHVFNIFDVGGQRNERKKWIHAFSKVDALLFVAALNHYNAVLFEDESKNSMHESLLLFDEIINSKWFRGTETILFLNKADLFALNLKQGYTLACCFEKGAFGWEGPDFWHPSTDLSLIDFDPSKEETDPNHFQEAYSVAVSFIEKQYLDLNNNKQRSIYVHVTTATDKENVEKVFWDVQNIAVRAGLHEGGVLI